MISLTTPISIAYFLYLYQSISQSINSEKQSSSSSQFELPECVLCTSFNTTAAASSRREMSSIARTQAMRSHRRSAAVRGTTAPSTARSNEVNCLIRQDNQVPTP